MTGRQLDVYFAARRALVHWPEVRISTEEFGSASIVVRLRQVYGTLPSGRYQMTYGRGQRENDWRSIIDMRIVFGPHDPVDIVANRVLAAWEAEHPDTSAWGREQRTTRGAPA